MSAYDRAALKITMTPILKLHTAENGCCADSFSTYQLELLREACGPEYAAVPLDDVRRMSINIRKSGDIGTGSSKAPRKSTMTSAAYREYLGSPQWKARAEAFRAAWDHRCAICYSSAKLEVHHRTYERLGHELNTDCIPLCKHCHKMANGRRRREAMKGNTVGLFNDD